MPVHYGSRDLYFQTIASTLTTQLPHAAGSAYGLKLLGEHKRKAKQNKDKKKTHKREKERLVATFV
jgi:TPP-dependent pyruvate/acetoin dehydrogenase alpha subunit